MQYQTRRISAPLAAAGLILSLAAGGWASPNTIPAGATRPSTTCKMLSRRMFCLSPGLKPLWMGGLQYPEQAQAKHLQGQVVLDVTIDKSGRISAMRGQGPAILLKAVENAAHNWRWDTKSKLPAHLTLVFEFALADHRSEALRRRYEALDIRRPNEGMGVLGRSSLYPEEAKVKGIEGLVALRVIADAERKVTSVQVIESDNALLTNAAIKLVSQPSATPIKNPSEQQLREEARDWHYWKPGVSTAVVDFYLNPLWRPGEPPLAAGFITSAPAGLMVIQQSLATYPPAAAAQNLQGEVPVRLTIDASGRVSQVNVLSGPEALRASALEAARQWRFLYVKHPPVQVAVTYLFELP